MSLDPNDDRNVPRASGREERSTRNDVPPRPPGSRNDGGLGLTLLILLLIVTVGGFIWWRSYDSAGNVAARHREVSTVAMPDLTSRSYGVAVGRFDDEDAAIGERDRLTGITHLPVSVGQVNVGSAVEFQVILGSYTSQADAESVGRSLQKSSIVKDWRVVPLSQSM